MKCEATLHLLVSVRAAESQQTCIQHCVHPDNAVRMIGRWQCR